MLKVPILKYNMICCRAQKRGFAELLEWSSLSSDSLHSAITRLAEDAEVRDKLREAHDLFVDQKESPVERWCGILYIA